MGEIRFTPTAIEKLVNASEMSDISKAVGLIRTLLDKKIIEEKVDVRFDQKTGDPKKQEWKLIEKWDGELWIESKTDCLPESPNFRDTDPLCISLTEFLKPGQVMIVKDVVISYVPSHSESEGTIPEHFQFQKAVKVIN